VSMDEKDREPPKPDTDIDEEVKKGE